MTLRYSTFYPVLMALWWCASLAAPGQEKPSSLASVELEEAREGLEVAWSEMEALQTSLDALRKEHEATRSELASRTELLGRLKGALLDQRAKVAELVALRAADAARIAELEAASADEAMSRGPSRAVEKKLESMRRQVSSLTEKVRASEAEMRKLDADQQDQAQRVRDVEKSRARAEDMAADLQRERDELQRQVDAQAGLLAERQAELADLRRALAARGAEAPTGAAVPASEPVSGEGTVVTIVEVEEPEGMEMARVRDEVAEVAPGAPEGERNEFELIVAGNQALKEGKIFEAEALFNEALAKDPDLVGARLGLAACYYSRSNLREAKWLVDKLVREDPGNAQALGLAGIIAWQEGDARRAARHLEKAVGIDPNDAQLHNYAGIVYHARQQHDRAVSSLRRAVELDPAHSEAMFNLSVLLATARMPDLAEAKALYEKAVGLGSPRDETLEELLNR